MAIIECITLSPVECDVHKSIREYAQRLYDQHGIRLTQVNIDWYEFSSLGENRATIAAMHIETKTM